jgi:hypothetical protein
MKRRDRGRPLVLVLLIAAAVAGCGGDDSEPKARSAATPAPFTGAPQLGCADRVEAEGNEAGPVAGPESLDFGVKFGSFGFLRGARPSSFFKEPERRYGSHALMLVLRADVRATLAIPADERGRTGLRYVPGTPVDGPFTVANGGTAVRFEACATDEPARTYEGNVGEWTEFAGDILLSEAGCHRVELHVDGQPSPLSGQVSIPAGRCDGDALP